MTAFLFWSSTPTSSTLTSPLSTRPWAGTHRCPITLGRTARPSRSRGNAGAKSLTPLAVARDELQASAGARFYPHVAPASDEDRACTGLRRGLLWRSFADSKAVAARGIGRQRLRALPPLGRIAQGRSPAAATSPVPACRRGLRGRGRGGRFVLPEAELVPLSVPADREPAHARHRARLVRLATELLHARSAGVDLLHVEVDARAPLLGLHVGDRSAGLL